MIGVFDSGDGGLPTLEAMRKLLPQYDYLYLGDHARAPYGPRSQEEIFEFTWQGVKYLFEQGCVLVILACNTASANALRRIQQERLPETFPDRHVLGILVPTVEQIADLPPAPSLGKEGERSTVLVLGTEATVKSQAYVTEVQKRNGRRRILQQACPDLVPLIEQGASVVTIHAALNRYLGPRKKLSTAFVPFVHSVSSVPSLSSGDAVMLGCTHYELIADLIAEHLPFGVKLYGQSAILAQSLKAYLDRHPEIASRLTRNRSVRYLTTANAASVSSRAPFVSIDL